MAQMKTPVQTVRVDYVCDKCREGVMRPLNIMLTVYPPLYPHRCTHCDAEKTLWETYPYIDYVEVSGSDTQ